MVDESGPTWSVDVSNLWAVENAGYLRFMGKREDR